MNAYRDTNGNLIIILKKDELDNLAPNIQTTQEKTNVDPFMYFRRDTVKFLKKLDEKFGTNVIPRNHEYVKELTREYYIIDLANVLKKLVRNQFAEVTYKKTKVGQGVKIESFRLLINRKY